MGFLSSIGGLFGGSKSSTTQGYKALPKDQRRFLSNAVAGANQYILPYTSSGGVNQANIDRFTPLPQTADETAGMEALRTGFTPTPESLNADISMLSNPFDSYVIDEINRQGSGDYSILKQALNEAGQMGSNRNFLAANDIDLTRTNQIGQFRQDQYNKILDSALTTLPHLREQDALGLMGIGEFQRGLDMQTKQAPVSALQMALEVLKGTGISGANAGTSTSTGKNYGSGILGNLAGTAGSYFAAGAGGVNSGGSSGFTDAGWNNFLATH